MNLKQIINKENLHHAYCIEGSDVIVAPLIISFFENEMGMETQSNPDIHIEKYDTFSIEESRSLKEKQQKMSFGDRKVFIISFSFITREAQNALLKIFEEPTSNTHFFIITKATHTLLPTLRSRLVVISYNEDRVFSEDIKKFFRQSGADRLAQMKDIIEAKDKNRAIEFVIELERHLTKDKENITKFSNFLEDLVKLKKFLFTQGASVKLVLEQIALNCPTT